MGAGAYTHIFSDPTNPGVTRTATRFSPIRWEAAAHGNITPAEHLIERLWFAGDIHSMMHTDDMTSYSILLLLALRPADQVLTYY